VTEAILVANPRASAADYRLHLYDAAPDAILDNAAWDLPAVGNDRSKYLGFIDIVLPADLGPRNTVRPTSIVRSSSQRAPRPYSR
jgi:hypothetical protein